MCIRDSIGDNRYHSIFGDDNGCFAVSSHDTAPALVALGATVVTTKREVPAEEFFGAHGHRSNVLEDGEVVKEFRVPKAEKSAFQKFALRKSIDFPVVDVYKRQVSHGMQGAKCVPEDKDGGVNCAGRHIERRTGRMPSGPCRSGGGALPTDGGRWRRGSPAADEPVAELHGTSLGEPFQLPAGRGPLEVRDERHVAVGEGEVCLLYTSSPA